MDNSKSILIIEDELALQNAIKIKLERHNFKVFTARDVASAIKVISSNSISVIWLDHYLLGGEDGLDFVIKIKSNENYNKIPIFVVSNTASPEKISAYLQLGVSDFYTKANHKLEDMINDIESSIQ